MIQKIFVKFLAWIGENWFRAGILSAAILVVMTAFISYQDYLDRKDASQMAELSRKEAESKKQYIADRKNDCLNIYKTEGAKWNNVRGYRYDDEGDLCYIRYSDPKPKTDAKCDETYPTDKRFTWWRENMLCKDGEFENSF